MTFHYDNLKQRQYLTPQQMSAVDSYQEDESAVLNTEFIPRHNPIGTWLIVKIDNPEAVKIGDTAINAKTGMTESGLIAVPSQSLKEREYVIHRGQVEVTVFKVGGCCFQREDLQDALGLVRPETRVVIKQFQGRSIPDEQGNKTLYYHIKEDDVLGVIPNE